MISWLQVRLEADDELRTSPREDWHPYDPMLISEGMFGFVHNLRPRNAYACLTLFRSQCRQHLQLHEARALVLSPPTPWPVANQSRPNGVRHPQVLLHLHMGRVCVRLRHEPAAVVRVAVVRVLPTKCISSVLGIMQ